MATNPYMWSKWAGLGGCVEGGRGGGLLKATLSLLCVFVSQVGLESTCDCEEHEYFVWEEP